MSGPDGGPRRARKTTVEECYTLDVHRLGDNILPPGGVLRESTGWLYWHHPDTGEQTASVRYRLTRHQEALRLDLDYQVGEQKERLPIWLTTTPVYFGGSRWWFLCPLARCGRRVGRLYLPPGGRYLGCRHCYDLTYRSSQKTRGLKVGDPRWCPRPGSVFASPSC